MCGNFEESEEEGESVTESVAACLRSGGAGGVPSSRGEGIVTHQNTGIDRWKESDKAQTLRSASGGNIANLATVPNVSPALKARDCKGPSSDGDGDGAPLIPVVIPLNSMTMQGRPADKGRMGGGIGKDGDPSPTITKEHHHAVFCFKGGQGAKARSLGISETVAPTLPSSDSGSNRSPTIAIRTAQTSANGCGITEDLSYTLDETQGQAVGAPSVKGAMAIRKLTERECERLQGFPDDWTAIPWKGKPAEKCPSGPRYRALGNSMAVTCISWIGKRIQQVEDMLK
jgi:DNA (cytosine-5)-methyltransferase 1